MPAQTKKSNLGALIRKHANDPTEFMDDFSRLPGGIHGGVAKLVEARLGAYKTGKGQGGAHIYLGATVLEPATTVHTVKIWDEKMQRGRTVSAKEVPVKGLRTSQTLPLCAGPGDKDEEQNVAETLNKLRIAFGDDVTNEIESEEDLASRLATLKEEKPLIRFKTETPDPTVKYPEPITFERWIGRDGLENFSPSDNGQAVEDHTAQGGEQVPQEDDLDALVEAAAGEDPESEDHPACDRLRELATEAGIAGDDIDNAEDWEAVKGLIEAARGAAPEVLAAAEEPWAGPAKEEIYLYKPIDPKTKKPFADPKTKKERKPIQCEVVAVDKKSRTCDLKNLVDKKTKYLKIKWDDLESE